MNRRTFVGLLSAVPFLGYVGKIKPSKPAWVTPWVKETVEWMREINGRGGDLKVIQTLTRDGGYVTLRENVHKNYICRAYCYTPVGKKHSVGAFLEKLPNENP